MSVNELPPPVGPRGLAVRCAIQGAAAHDAGAPVLACPYGPSRPFSRRAWLVGYARAERAAGVDRAAWADDVDDDAPFPETP